MIKHVELINRILLGLVMLVPGLIKLFQFTPSGVSGMLAGLGFPAPTVFAWILIIAEIVTGLAIIANWKMEYAVWPPIVILVVAAFTSNLYGGAEPNIAGILMHLALASNYLIFGMYAKHKGTKHKK